jgi:hypothetical protein
METWSIPTLPFVIPSSSNAGTNFFITSVFHRCQGADVFLAHPVHRVPAPLVASACGKEDRFFVSRHEACISREEGNGPPQWPIACHVPYILGLEAQHRIQLMLLDLFIERLRSFLAHPVKIYPFRPINCKVHDIALLSVLIFGILSYL